MPETQPTTYLSSPATSRPTEPRMRKSRKVLLALLAVALVALAIGVAAGMLVASNMATPDVDNGNSSQSSTSETASSESATTTSATSSTSATTTSTQPVIEGWVRKEFSFEGEVMWDVYYPTGSMLFEAGLKEGGLGIVSTLNNQTYDFNFNYPKGEVGATIDAWVAADSVAYAGPGGKKGTVADKNGVEIRVVRDVKNSSGENTAYVYIWKSGETNRRLIYITTKDTTANLNVVVDKFVVGLNPAI